MDDAEWYGLALRIERNDEAVRVANEAVGKAEMERDRIYREQMAKEGIPERIADIAVADQYAE